MIRKSKNTTPIFSQKHGALSHAIRLACMGATIALSPYAHAGLITQNNVQALLVTESVGNGAEQTTSTVGPLTNAGGYQGQSVTGAGANNSGALGVVPPNATLGSTIYQNNTNAINAVVNYLQGAGGSGTWLQTIANTMAGAMKSSGSASGAQMGLFTFVQNVQIANPTGGTPTQAQVYASVLVYPNGQYEFLGANVNNNTIFLLYANYQQAKDAYYLPAGWTVPYAGDLQWELLEVTVQGNTINGSVVPVGGQLQHVINDNGAYDGIVTMVNGKQVVNYGPAVKSLMTNQIDPLMKQNNATTGIVLYGEQVKVQRNGAGQPLTAINVTNRTLTASCGGPGTLTSSGQYGYLLTELDNEYLVQSNGSYSQANQISQNTYSPTAAFNESANVGSNPQFAQYVNDLVFPIAPDAGQVVNYTSGSPLPESDYVGMAPLENNAQGGGNTEINSYVGPINVCVGSQNYEANSPEYSGCFGSTKGGCNSQPMHTEAEWNPLIINGNYDGVAGFSPNGFLIDTPYLAWNPTTYIDSFNPPMITGGLNSLYIDDQNGWWGTAGGICYYGCPWNPPSAPQNMQSDYLITATPGSGDYYSCTQSGCTVSRGIVGFK
jgi:hypothetical protein